MTPCQQLKQHLVEHGLEAVRDDQQLVGHLESCAECTGMLEAYAAIPDLLDELPEHDPSDALLAGTNEAIEAPSIGKTTRFRWNGQIAAAMGTGMVMLAVLGLSQQFLVQERWLARRANEAEPAPLKIAAAPAVDKVELRQTENEVRSKDRSVNQYSGSGDKLTNDSISVADGRDELDAHRNDNQADADGFSNAENKRTGRKQATAAVVGGLTGSETAPNLELPASRPEESYRDAKTAGGYEKSAHEIGAGGVAVAVEPPASVTELNGRLSGTPGKSDTSNLNALLDETRSRHSRSKLGQAREFDVAADPGEERADGNFKLDSAGQAQRIQPQREAREPQVAAAPTDQGEAFRRSIKSKPNPEGEAALYPESSKPSDDELSEQLPVFDFEQKKNVPVAAQEAGSAIQKEIVVTGSRIAHFDAGGFDFLNHYEQTSDLSFQSPEGYWANNHIPGDPEIRLLSARLARWDRTALGESWRLEQDVTPVKQPFDAPENNALALTLMGDANAVDGPTRMRLQVGIRGIEHLRGQRPAMNLAVVVDLPDDADDSVRIASRALLEALLSSKQSGDRFSLVMSGGPESLTIPPEEFRFGPLQLATQAIAGQQPRPAGVRGSLLDAVHSAAKLVKSGDDPSRPLGSSAILLISAGGLAEVDELAGFAHQQARDGITFSVFPLGDRPRSADVEKLVLAGLGNRRYLESPDRARALVEEELHSASRAVARAARLAIRLAPGVRLIDVIGSHRLDLADSQRVKEIETSMDQRLRSNLGIEADRGDDENGIQIIIPSVFEDDSLTVLLDVIVDQAGPVADVSLRYKDLVFKKNGTLRSRFVLTEGALNRGPSELAVLKNLLAHHFSQSVKQAAEALGREQVELASSELAAARATLAQLRSQINAWQDDPELLRDQQVLERYIGVLTSPTATSHQALLADSLRYAAWAKAHRPPECVIHDSHCSRKNANE